MQKELIRDREKFGNIELEQPIQQKKIFKGIKLNLNFRLYLEKKRRYIKIKQISQKQTDRVRK